LKPFPVTYRRHAISPQARQAASATKAFSTHHDFFGILHHDDLLLKIRWTIDGGYDPHRSLLGQGIEHMGRCQDAVQRSDRHQRARSRGLGVLGSFASSQPRKSNNEMSRFLADLFGAENEFL